jgi:hypothetical protein
LETSKGTAGTVNNVSSSKHNNNKSKGNSVRDGVSAAVPGLTQLDLERQQDIRPLVSVASFEVLGGIPDVAGRVQEQHRSDSVSEVSLVRAERLKARYNLEDQSSKGNDESFVGFPENFISNSFKNIGILVQLHHPLVI